MKIIVSPARTMQVDTDSLPYQHLPQFLSQTQEILSWMRGQTYDELHRLWWNCSTKIATLNYRRVQEMDLTHQLTPAILAFKGLQYQYMAPDVFTDQGLEYIERHLRILSGLYGILRPFDGIVPYRLEMQAKLKTDFCKNLYDYWGDSLYRELVRDSKVILNLASEEYSKIVRKHLEPDVQFITCRFCEESGDKLVEKGVYVKMARGEMVRFMAENGVTSPEQVKEFTGMNYTFRQELSDGSLYTFVR